MLSLVGSEMCIRDSNETMCLPPVDKQFKISIPKN
jgi:hypothetical protein